MRASELVVLVLAAGQGTRMRSKRIKLLHVVAGRPMVAHVLETARALRPSRMITVVGYQAEDVQAALAPLCDRFAMQSEQRGTGHAVMQAAPALRDVPEATLLILNGDLPTLRARTLRTLVTQHHRSDAALSLITAELPDPRGYGRVVRDARGQVTRIVEDRDAGVAEKRIREINCGIYCSKARTLLPVLRRLRPNNSQGEYYLTDAVHTLLEEGKRVIAVRHEDADEVLGVNTRAELARASRTLFDRKAQALEASGVTLLDASRTWIDPRARVGRDTVIYPDVHLEGSVVVGEDCVIHSGTRIVDSTLGRGVLVRDHCVVLESKLGDDTAVGPFAHLRPGSVLEADARVGNFVELKKTRLGKGTKAPHLSYLGDADIGAGCNIGAGTITCNYDGSKKNPTTLEDGVFIGSDAQLVAPLHVGRGAYVAAGATVTQNVPAGALAISRVPQANVEGWVERRKNRKP